MKVVRIFTTDGEEIRSKMTEEQLLNVVTSVSEGIVLTIGDTEHYLFPNQVVRIEAKDYNEDTFNRVDAKEINKYHQSFGYTELNI